MPEWPPAEERAVKGRKDYLDKIKVSELCCPQINITFRNIEQEQHFLAVDYNTMKGAYMNNPKQYLKQMRGSSSVKDVRNSGGNGKSFSAAREGHFPGGSTIP